MTQANKPRRAVTATVAGHEVHNGKPLTKLDIPEWESQYPLSLYGTTPEQQAQMPIGQTLRILLQCDRQKDNSDGSKPWMFFWSFVSIVGPDDEPPPPDSEPEPPAGGRASQPSKPAVRDQGYEIHLSVSLQQAVVSTVAMIVSPTLRLLRRPACSWRSCAGSNSWQCQDRARRGLRS